MPQGDCSQAPIRGPRCTHSVSIGFHKRGNVFRRKRSPCSVALVQHLRRSLVLLPEIEQAAFGLNVRSRSQREKVPGGGASGYWVRNRMEAGGADCPSVSCGIAVPGGSGAGCFLRGSTTACGGCGLRAVLIFFFGALGDTIGVFSGATATGGTGAVPGNPTPSSGRFAVSNQREKLAFRSSIAAHPPIPTLAERAIKTSATRARARIDLAIVGVAGSHPDVGAGARMTLSGCHTVNSLEPAGLRGPAAANACSRSCSRVRPARPIFSYQPPAEVVSPPGTACHYVRCTIGFECN
jgi:hypothetical protein